jgi:alkylresorcinol/alkylpyrone synthase
MVTVRAVAIGFPAYYYSQDEIAGMLVRLWEGRLDPVERLIRFHRNMGIDGRFLALPLDNYLTLQGFQASNDLYIQASLALGEKVLCRLFDETGTHPEDISLLAFTTVTGLAVPSIDARLMNRIPFKNSMKRLPIFGYGCMGGAAALARVADYLKGHPEEAAVLLSIELCSLTLQRDDLSTANLVSTGLFGDGAAAVLMGGDRYPNGSQRCLNVVDNRSIFFPQTEGLMGYEIGDNGFRMLLDSTVADVVEARLRQPIQEFLAAHGLTIEDLNFWLVHPGGPKIMQAVERSLNLRNDELALSHQSLAKYGNVSSASVLLILAEALRKAPAPAGSFGLMMAFGPAFSVEMVLLKW